MKTLTTLLAILIISIGTLFSQDTFIYDINGLSSEYIVLEFPDKTQSELYQKTLNYIQDAFENPDEVIKNKIKDNKIRYSGYDKNGIYVSIMGGKDYKSVNYSIEILFKDGKIKFVPIYFEYLSASEYGVNWINISLDDGSSLYKKNGKPYKMTRDYPLCVQKKFNTQFLRLVDYINNTADVAGNENEW